MPGTPSINVLPTEKIDAALSALDQWAIANGALTRSFTFKNFSQAFAFMTRVALLAEKAGHHPDWSNSYNRVDISLVTHAKGGITQKDLDLAKAIDRL